MVSATVFGIDPDYVWEVRIDLIELEHWVIVIDNSDNLTTPTVFQILFMATIPGTGRTYTGTYRSIMTFMFHTDGTGTCGNYITLFRADDLISNTVLWYVT